MNELTIPPNKIVRIFIADGTHADMALTVPWEVLLHGLITQGFLCSSEVWVNRPSIVKIVLCDAPVDYGAPNVVSFPDPKGSA